MSEENKSYRIRTNVGGDTFLNVKLDQEYNTFDILSLNVDYSGTYKLHNSNYGVIVGRVLANNGFGIPNAKISVFISANTETDTDEMLSVYNYQNTSSTNASGVRYNLLEDFKVSNCHKPVGTMPSKTYLLDNNTLMEVFDKYYKLTTKSNDAGDYMLMGVPVGLNTIHMDLDLSDCGILSQKPRDFVYKGYNIEQFDSPTQFKTGTTLDSLAQICSQNTSVYVYPFWGNEELGETIGITRCDINVNFKFEPTCVFMGSVITDQSSQGLSKKCVPTNQMGRMDEMTTGEGRIEMIRKTPSGAIESFAIKGTVLIDGNGTWCYQIPMNLDYIVTDEYGNTVATDDPTRGIPTRTSVRFRMSMSDFDGNNNNADNFFRGKILVPHNPQHTNLESNEDANTFYDYNFGVETKDESFRDLMWNNVYTVKQYIPRFQKSLSYQSERFTGIKGCNHYGQNNPMPYNNIRIKMPLMFTLLCALIKAYIRIITILNTVNSWLCEVTRRLSTFSILPNEIQDKIGGYALESRLTAISDGLCPELENWYFTPSKYKASSHDNIAQNVKDRVFSGINGGTTDGPEWPDDAISTYTYTGRWRNIGDTSDGTQLPTGAVTITGVNAKYFVAIDDESTGNVIITDSSHYKNGKTNSNPDKYAFFKYDDINNIYTPRSQASANDSFPQGKWITVTNTGDDSDKIEVWVVINSYGYVSKEDEDGSGKPQGSENHIYRHEIHSASRKGAKITVKSGSTIYESEDIIFWYNKSKYESELKKMTWKNFATSEDFLNQSLDDDKKTPIVNLFNQTLYYIQQGEGDAEDSQSIDINNAVVNTSDGKKGICLTTKTDYLISCIEMNLAQEYRVINFDFYNDWVNGVLYFPRWKMEKKPKIRFRNGKSILIEKTRGCMTDSSIFGNTRRLTQQCAIKYDSACTENGIEVLKDNFQCGSAKQNCHKNKGKLNVGVFGNNGGLIKQQGTMLNQFVYYYKPCEWYPYNDKQKLNLFATDIVLLGSMDDCSRYGIPKAFEHMASSSYKLPTNLALTNMDDDAYVYGTQGGTFCSGSNGLETEDEEQQGVKRINPSFRDQEKFYSTMTSEENISYFNDMISRGGEGQQYQEDLFPVTEAAGIAWNYTGPGQGKISTDNNFYYQPGGHFLGLSCRNSETNLKTCLNLQRVCEMGVSLSQRRERVYGITANNTFKNRYFVPTGFIGNDDITDETFRSMFATMNSNILQVSKDVRDESTSYNLYKFAYQKEDGFEAGLNNYKLDQQYNQDVDMTDEFNDYRYLTFKGGILPAIAITGNSFDTGEFFNTYRKTTNLTSKGYTKFRFGVNKLEDSSLKYHFAYHYKNKEGEVEYYAMPIYENSFYFYFGLRDGSTAFDRFKSEFYSSCDNEADNNNAYIVITKDSIASTSDGGNKFGVTIYNMQAPYTIIVNNGKSTTSAITTNNSYNVTGLSIDEYDVIVTDDAGISVHTSVIFKEPEIQTYYLTQDVTYSDSVETGIETLKLNYFNDCGYVDLDKNIEINGVEYEIGQDNSIACVVIVDENKNYYFDTTTNGSYDTFNQKIDEIVDNATKIQILPYVMADEDSIKMYLPDNESSYKVYVIYKCQETKIEYKQVNNFKIK